FTRAAPAGNARAASARTRRPETSYSASVTAAARGSVNSNAEPAAVGFGSARKANWTAPAPLEGRSPTAVVGAAITASVAERAGSARVSAPEITLAPPAVPHGDPAVKRYS